MNYTYTTTYVAQVNFQWFKFGCREFKLHLETSTDIFLPEFKVYMVGKDGLKAHKSYQTKNIVRGYIEGKYKWEKFTIIY